MMRAGWAATLLALVLALIGIVLAIGGAWLLILGGSIYYLIAGIALLASAWFLFQGRLLGGWIYVGLFVLSAIWGFAEVARQCLGDGPVAGRAAGAADRRACW